MSYRNRSFGGATASRIRRRAYAQARRRSRSSSSGCLAAVAAPLAALAAVTLAVMAAPSIATIFESQRLMDEALAAYQQGEYDTACARSLALVDLTVSRPHWKPQSVAQALRIKEINCSEVR